MLNSDRAEVESRMVEVNRLEGRMHAVVKDSEALCVAPARVQELKAERLAFNAETEPEKVERDTSPARIFELKVAAGTRDGELGIVVRVLHSSKGPSAADEDKASTAKD